MIGQIWCTSKRSITFFAGERFQYLNVIQNQLSDLHGNYLENKLTWVLTLTPTRLWDVSSFKCGIATFDVTSISFLIVVSSIFVRPARLILSEEMLNLEV